MRPHETTADVMRRLVALQRIPLFAELGPSVLAGLAEHGRDVPLRRGQPLAARPAHVHFLSGPADVTELAPSACGFASHAPELVPWLAGGAVEGKIAALADGVAIEISAPHLWAALEDEFSLFLVVARALAEEGIRLAQSQRDLPVVAAPRRPSAASSLDLVSRVLELRSTLPFAQGRVASLVQLARFTTELRAPAGVELWREGDRADNAVVLVAGALRARVAGRDAFTLGPGSLLGGADALAGRPRWFTAITEGPVHALALPMERFLDTLEDQPELAREVLQAFARMLLSAWRRPPDGSGAPRAAWPL